MTHASLWETMVFHGVVLKLILTKIMFLGQWRRVQMTAMSMIVQWASIETTGMAPVTSSPLHILHSGFTALMRVLKNAGCKAQGFGSHVFYQLLR